MFKRKYRLNKKREKLELKNSKSEFKTAKNKYKIIKEKKSLLLKKSGIAEIELKDFNKLEYDLKKSKFKKKQQKKTYKQKKKEYNKKYKKHTIKKKAWSTANQLRSQALANLMNEDEDLAKYQQAKNKYGYYRANAEQITKESRRVVTKPAKLVYGVSNRMYNLARGRGFKRTPEQFRLSQKFKRRIFQNKRIEKLNRARLQAKKLTSPAFRLAKNVYKNPLNTKGLLSLFIILAILSLFMTTISPARMKEWDMNKTWLYFTKLDRKNSNDKVKYYSDVEEYIYFLNYRYDKSLKDIYGINVDAYRDKNLPDTSQGETYLDNMWDFLNKDENNLKTINNLMTEKEGYKLEDKELKEYRELLKVSNEIGKFPYARELDNFLYEKTTKEYNQPMKIIDRYGYKDSSTISDTTTFSANSKSYIYSPLTGKVTINGNSVSVEQGNKKITFLDLENIRVEDKKQVLRHEIVGEVKQSGNQVVKYEKLKDGKWKSVNIGFYLPKVEYVQKTEVIRPFTLDKEKSARIKKFIELVKNIEPNATNEGLAAILGNFDIESGINPKRAESDYEPPPVGASDESSWDNEEWLNMSGVQIYYGRYPNILRRGLGLGQWTDTMDGSVRHTLLLDFAKAKNKKWYDLDLQVDFMFNGDSPYYINHFRTIVTSTEDVAVLTRQFLNLWEGNPSDKLDSRINRAKDIYNYLKFAGTVGSFKDKQDQDLWNEVSGNYVNDPTAQGLQPHVAMMKQFLAKKFNVDPIYGVRGDSDGTGHGHGDGVALDLMLYENGGINSTKGQVIADYLAENFKDLGIFYIIWEQKFYADIQNIYGSANTWSSMPDRGSITQNHFDHVHISFKKQGEI